MPKRDMPTTFEVAVHDTGEVIINYRDLQVGPDGWGHLSFTVAQARAFLETFQQATVTAQQIIVAQALGKKPGN